MIGGSGFSMTRRFTTGLTARECVMNRAIAALVMALRDPYLSPEEKRTLNRVILRLRKIEKLRSHRIDNDMEARRAMMASHKVRQQIEKKGTC